MAKKLRQTTETAKQQYNMLFKNVFVFDDEDMEGYDKCFFDVFRKGVNLSYYTSSFYAQYTGELYVGMLISKKFRKKLVEAINHEKAHIDEPVVYWEKNMSTKRFGIPGKDYTGYTKTIMNMINTSYCKIAGLSEYFGTPEGKKDFESYSLTPEDVADMKCIIMQFPYLLRKSDHDKDFMKYVMKTAGDVVKEIMKGVE